MIATAGTSAGAGQSERLGVILLHAKLGDPLERRAGLDTLAANLLGAGHAIALPSMPWSDRGWLTIDRDVPATLTQIDRLASQLMLHGARRIVLVGHSLGADVALSYAVSRPGVAGLVMAAPSHTPAAVFARDAATRSFIERARSMVADGHGDAPFVGPDGDGSSHMLVTRAAVYLSWMDPEGLAEMSVQAPLLPASLPLLLVIGRRDQHDGEAERAVWSAARHPYSCCLPVGAESLATPRVAQSAIQDWIEGLPR